MTKDTTNTSYTSSAGHFEEVYGSLMQITSTNIISNESKNLQYLTNELFLAAKADIRLDRETSKTGITARQKIESKAVTNKNLKIFYNRIAEKTGKTPEEIQTAFEKDTEFVNKYNELKIELEHTRVFGVNKSTIGKLKTVLSNTARVAGKALAGLGIAIVGISAGAAILSHGDLTPDYNATLTDGGLTPNFNAILDISISKAGYLRDAFKDSITKSLNPKERYRTTKSDSVLELLSYGKKLKAYQNNIH